jgi:hypothetical protein
MNSLSFLPSDCEQEGASEDDIHQLPKFKFHRVEEHEKQSVNVTQSSGGIMVECGTNLPIEKALAAEDAVNPIFPDAVMHIF